MSSQFQSAGESDRVRCLYCGANNFPASAVCWQCSRPLKTVPVPPAGAANSGSTLSAEQRPGPMQPSGASYPAAFESPLASKAAAMLGLLFPYVGLPAGIIFLMLDDPRKTQLGWLMIGWSLAGTLISVISLAVTLGPLWALMKGMLPHPGGSPTPGPNIPDLDGGAGIILGLLSLTNPVARI